MSELENIKNTLSVWTQAGQRATDSLVALSKELNAHTDGRRPSKQKPYAIIDGLNHSVGTLITTLRCVDDIMPSHRPADKRCSSSNGLTLGAFQALSGLCRDIRVHPH